jgi:hypothetical protein
MYASPCYARDTILVLVFILFLFPLRQLQFSMQHALAKAGKKVKSTQTLTN